MITSTKLFLSAFAVVLLAQNVAAADEIFGSTFPAACTDTCASFEATVLKCSALTSTADLIACSCTADFQSQTQTCVQCIVTNAPGSDAATTAQTSAVGFAKNCQLPITLSSADAGAMSSLAVIDASLAAAAGGASSTASAAGSTTAAASSTSSAAASSSEIVTTADFYAHVTETLKNLLGGTEKYHFVTALSNASSLLFGSYENFEQRWGRSDGKRVNWSGFYLHPYLLSSSTPFTPMPASKKLYLGPFHGRPACLDVSLDSTRRAVGVCAAGYLTAETVVVPDVEKREGHIACDGATRSEIVVPVKINTKDGVRTIGVLDCDCEAENGFGEEDRVGLESFVAALVELIDWEL
ncbi:hypothetical protein MNV49_003966 [Pseudohyphozyma bogoriensis]|nr:hypothetical protein MNV49_003966 [Pseudohyphozyma bogoriensis]